MLMLKDTSQVFRILVFVIAINIKPEENAYPFIRNGINPIETMDFYMQAIEAGDNWIRSTLGIFHICDDGEPND
jgi:hypothetical protein